MKSGSSLDSFFFPRSVAHIGASEKGLYPSELFRTLMQWDGTVYPVNPGRGEVFSIPAFASVSLLPEVPDLALITVSRAKVVPIVEECIRAGIGAAVIISSGFAESDDEGRILQESLKKLAEKIRIIGPNCAGLASVSTGFTLTRMFCRPRTGGVSFVSSSGALMMALFGSFAGRGIGIRFMASVGNQVDVSLEEILDYYIEEGGSRVLTAFIEGIGSPDRYIRTLIKARERGFPLILVKSGTSEIGSRAAATHTASIASSGRVFTEISRQYGAVLVESPAAMLDLALVAEIIGKPRGGRIAVLSQSGGAASLTADLISRRPALSLPGLPPRLTEAIGRMEGIPEYAELMNPLDARGDVMRGKSIAELISITADSEAFDLMFLLFAKNPNREIEEETARGIIAGRDCSPLPLIVIWMGEGEGGTGTSGAFSLLKEAGLPLFYDPAPAVSACASLLESWNEN